MPLENTIQSWGTLWTDLHSILHEFHGTVDGLLEPVTCFLGEGLEPRPREPVWEMPYCPRFRQLLVGAVRVHGHARIGMASTRNFPGTKAVLNTHDASRIVLRNRSSVDLGCIPYVTDNMTAPGTLRESADT